MNYRIEISSVAEAEADSAFVQMSQVTSPDRASQWYEGLLKVIETLSMTPKRCPRASEDVSVVSYAFLTSYLIPGWSGRNKDG